MNGSRNGVVKHLNGHGIAEGASDIEVLRPQPPKLVDELAEAMGMARETFERPRPAATASAAFSMPLEPQTTTLPAMPPPRNFFDDEDDDAAMPIPSTWRNPPEPPPRSRGISDQLRATGLGFGTGLAIVIPIVLLMTGYIDNTSVSQLANMLPNVAVLSPDTSRSGDPVASGLQQRSVSTTAFVPVSQPAAPVLSTPPTAVEPAPAPIPEIAAAPVDATPSQTTTAAAPSAPPAAEAAPAFVPAPIVALPPPATEPVSSAPATPAVSPLPTVAAAPAAVSEITEGRQLFRTGDVAGGRNILARAAATGNAEAMMALAETYDPNMLAAWGIMNAAPDVATARRLYAKAFEAGQAAAGTRLKGLE